MEQRLFFVSARDSRKPVTFEAVGKEGKAVNYFGNKEDAKKARNTLIPKYEVKSGTGNGLFPFTVVQVILDGKKEKNEPIIDGATKEPVQFAKRDEAELFIQRLRSASDYVVRKGPDHWHNQ